jgi:RNA polymerase sigma-70 factor (ECF subfamily)
VQPDAAAISLVFRDNAGRSVAALVRAFGDIDLAEDAVQDAFAVAVQRWPSDGFPPNPGAWITTTARNRALDRLRRESRERELLGQVDVPLTSGSMDEKGLMHDDRLQLIFTCCHPALSPEARVALTLRLLGGLSTEEVASAFLVPESTMAQRLVRAKHKIKAARIPYRVPAEHEMPNRLRAALAVLYLIYTAGLSSLGERGLCGEAIRLVRTVRVLMPDEPEVAGLLALLLLTEARRGARFREDGTLVLLADQDRSRWHRASIEEGHQLVRWCLARNRPGPYQLQAAINAVHADAASAEATDWSQILALYDQLLEMAPTPVVSLNRAVAVAEVHGPSAALGLVDELELHQYYLFHATRADLLWRLGRQSEADAAYARAAALAPTDAERQFLSRGGRGAR